MSTELKPRQDFLDTALACGATLTGKPDGSEAVSVVFTIDAWRKFDSAIQQAEAQQPATTEPVVYKCRHCGVTTIEDEDGVTMHGLPAPDHPIIFDPSANVPIPGRPEPVQVFLVRDVASLLEASVPDVCDALAELGYEPRRSTNAAISPDEAIAVAKRINPSPGVPEKLTVDPSGVSGTADEGYVAGWNACRAAMLAASTSKKDGAT